MQRKTQCPWNISNITSCQCLRCKLSFFFFNVQASGWGARCCFWGLLLFVLGCCRLQTAADYCLYTLGKRFILEWTHTTLLLDISPFHLSLALCRQLLLFQLLLLFICTWHVSSMFSEAFIFCSTFLPSSLLWHTSTGWLSSESDFCSPCALLSLSLVLKTIWSVICLPAVLSNLHEEANSARLQFQILFGRVYRKTYLSISIFTSNTTLNHLRSHYCLTFLHL